MSKVQTSINASHLLSLIHLKTDCYYTSVTADFTPPPRYIFSKLSMNRASNSIVPALLKNKNYFTPSFIIPCEKVKSFYDVNGLFTIDVDPYFSFIKN